jgi:hypothetical protein
MRNLTIACLVMVVTACSGQTGVGNGGDDDVGDDDVGDDDVPGEVTASGPYKLVTDMDIPADAILPQTAYDVSEVLHDLREDPGHAVLDLLELAGVPLVAELRALMPSVLEDQVEDWIADAITDHTDLSALDQVLAVTDHVIGEIDLTSELTVAGTTSTHQLETIRFGASTVDITVPLDAVADLPVALTDTTVTVSDGQLAVGDHFFGVPIGEYAWIAFEQALVATTGQDARGTLAAIIDCPAMAAQVADTGVWGVEVGHEAELLAICETGLDKAVEKLREKFLGLDFQAIHFSSGQATLVDDDADGQADRLTGGVWQATIDAGMGPRGVTAVFTGTR